MTRRLRQQQQVRCASCRRLFTTNVAGRIRCSWCGAEVELEVEPHMLAPEVPEETKSGLHEQPPPPDAAEVKTAVGEETAWQSPADESAAASPLEPVPWENLELGLGRRLVLTVRQVLLQPGDFFMRLGQAAPWRALLFGWLLATLAAAVFAGTALWELNNNPQGWLDATGIAPGADPQQLLDRARQVLQTMLWAAPLLGLLNVLLSALFYHLGIWLLAERPSGLAQTLRVTAYGCTPLVLVLIPLVGQILGSFWSMWVQVLGLAVVHRVTVLRAAVAVLVPSMLALMLLGVVL